MKVNKKVFAVLAGAILLMAFAWQLVAGGVGEGDVSVNESLSAHTLYSKMAGATQVVIDGIIGVGWDAYAYKDTISLLKIGGGNPMPATIWIMNDNAFLYIALRWEDDYDDTDTVWLFFDEEHDHLLTAASTHSTTREHDRHWFSEDLKKRTAADTDITDWFFNWFAGPPERGWLQDTVIPTGRVNGASAWSHDGSHYSSEWRLPLNSQDRLDINVKSGAILGLYIQVMNISRKRGVWGYPYAEPNVWQDIPDYAPFPHDDLWTTKVFSASIPHAHDDVGMWRAFVGVQNTGTEGSTVVFRFSDGYVTERTLNSGEHMGEFVKDLHGGTNFIGSILVYSDQPFTATLSQRDAAKDMGLGFIYVGEN